MSGSSKRELATVHFYDWELRTRGYYHFPTVVDIEPKYKAFEHLRVSRNHPIDDGKVPPLWKRIAQTFIQPQVTEEEEEEEFLATAIVQGTKLFCIELHIPSNQEVSVPITCQLLELLCHGNSPCSFEIIANGKSIVVQFTGAHVDRERLVSQLTAFFPTVGILDKDVYDLGCNIEKDIALADFALAHESMVPLAMAERFDIDPLIPLFATMERLQEGQWAMFQVLFKSVAAPWAYDMNHAISDGQGGCFFSDQPHLVKEAGAKTSAQLFAVIIRVAAQGHNTEESNSLASELAHSISHLSAGTHNALVPLDNIGYDYQDHLRNVFHRQSNRTGSLLNTKELAQFVHIPNKTIVGKKFRGTGNAVTSQLVHPSKSGITLGENVHNGIRSPVLLDIESRLSHTHIIGATGMGKSTLLANMILQDIEQGRGCCLFDPHGDICDDVLSRIPPHRKDEVIVIDPADTTYPVGFNLLHAPSEQERTVLNADMVSAFKTHATAWGDTMTSVLSNAVATLLESPYGGTVLDLKRLLLDESFRKKLLGHVDDPMLHLYWKNEYPMVKKSISPLLTRIDTFVRPKTIRYMLAQKNGVDLCACVQHNKIVLIKLSVGLIGASNSYLLGSLLLSKFNQATLARQGQDTRSPYFLYLDEFQNFISPSIATLLSSARKYGVGLVLAHQELSQINDPQLLNSLLGNASIRVAFRTGEQDARKLSPGFLSFEWEDFLRLKRGEAIVRIGASTNNANLKTNPLSKTETGYTEEIIANTRRDYGRKRSDIERELYEEYHLPEKEDPQIAKKTKKKKEEDIPTPKQSEDVTSEVHTKKEEVANTSAPQKKDLQEKQADYLKAHEQSQQESLHRTIQNRVRTEGQVRGFVVQLEAPTQDGKRIDVTLHKGDIRIAVEISVTNTIAYEVSNIQKCFNEGYQHVYLLSESPAHAQHIKEAAHAQLGNDQCSALQLGTVENFISFLDTFQKPQKNENQTKHVRGYRVNTSYSDIPKDLAHRKNQTLEGIILRNLRNFPKEE